MELSSIGGFCNKKDITTKISSVVTFVVAWWSAVKKQKTANSSRISGLFVVPPGIVLSTQTSVYHYFSE